MRRPHARQRDRAEQPEKGVPHVRAAAGHVVVEEAREKRARQRANLIRFRRAPRRRVIVTAASRRAGRRRGRPTSSSTASLANTSSSDASLRQVAQPRRRVVGDDAAFTQDDHPRADLLDRVHLVRAVEDDAAVARQAVDQRAQGQHRADVESRGRFVEDDDRRIMQQRREPAALSAACPSRRSTSALCRSASRRNSVRNRSMRRSSCAGGSPRNRPASRRYSSALRYV